MILGGSLARACARRWVAPCCLGLLALAGASTVWAQVVATSAEPNSTEPTNVATASAPAAVQEPSAAEEPSAPQEPSAAEEPSALKEPSAPQEPSALKEPSVSPPSSVLPAIPALPAIDQPELDRAERIVIKEPFSVLTDRARALAGKAPQERDPGFAPEIANLDYKRFNKIRFRPEQSLWHGQYLFDVQFLHPGSIYRAPVKINVLKPDGTVEHVPFSAAAFDYSEAGLNPDKLRKDYGFSGFRLHFPLNSGDYKDEFVVFQGASYFRVVGAGERYGLSARGLAIDTGEASGEMFPRFSEFWIREPQPDDTQLEVFALLESGAVTGAYRFRFEPGSPTEADVDVRLFARHDVRKLGVAPLTSMFFFGENTVKRPDDVRAEVHDSDGLQVLTGANEWIWRPLVNPAQLRITSSMDAQLKGFGLLQRDRSFEAYLDSERRYELRPGLWVTPTSDWGPGRVELVEIPTESEHNDNIVAYWVPQQPVRAGEALQFSYRLSSVGMQPPGHDLARVVRTQTGKVSGRPEWRQFVVDFAGFKLNRMSGSMPIEPILTTSAGKLAQVQVTRLPNEQGWRVAFQLKHDNDGAVDMRLYLQLRGEKVSEVWNYVWNADAGR